MKQEIWYCNAWKALKHIIWTNDARNHISLISIYVDYSYSNGIKMKDRGPHPSHTSVNQGGAINGSERHVPAWLLVHH